MKIQVLSHYDTVDTVDARDLKRLIAEGEILAFRRAGGWVKIGTDAIRGQGGHDYDGPERRDIIQKPLPKRSVDRSMRLRVRCNEEDDPDELCRECDQAGTPAAKR